MNHLSIDFLLLCSLLSPYLSFQKENCSSKVNCDTCIQISGCIWCSDPDLGNKHTRCQKENKRKCAINYTTNPKNNVTIVQNNTSMHISPQKITLKLRPNFFQPKLIQRKFLNRYLQESLNYDLRNPQKIEVRYTQPNNYPVDLYFLMDHTDLNSDSQNEIPSTADKLVKKMSKWSTNLRLGFGTFAEKPEEPFIYAYLNGTHDTTCHGKPNCKPTNDFQNVIPIQTFENASLFADQVKKAVQKIMENVDGPEAVFDAIMQVVVCKDKIGWRDNARKLLIVVSDGKFHSAGDGRLGGIMEPNDGCCHLDENGYYTHGTKQDYPSVGQLRYALKGQSIYLVFVVPNELEPYHLLPDYEQLSQFIEHSYAERLGRYTSTSITLATEKIYKEIKSQVQMLEKNVGEFLKLNYFSKCSFAKNATLKQTNRCNVTSGDTVTFEIDVELLSCPADRNKWTQQLTIYPYGLNENLTIDVEMLCDGCNCSRQDDTILNSTLCSNRESLKCGVCECKPMYNNSDDGCRQTPTSSICSSRGECRCNECRCHSNDYEVFWGDFCQCSNFTCPLSGGKLCSGHGSCVCGSCQCNVGWINQDCACEDSTSNCVGPNGEICSDHGICECNRCVCNESEQYVGRLCEKPSKYFTKCNELKHCVECKVYNTGPLIHEECAKCDLLVDEVENVEKTDDQYTICSYEDENQCKFTYSYKIENKNILVKVQKLKYCRAESNIFGIVFLLVTSIVVIGIGTLVLWKVLTTIQDRKEMAKFNEELNMAKWDSGQSPIYVQAISTFKNPMYEEMETNR